MSKNLQELAESVLIKAMNGGELAGMVFRHGDNVLKSRKNSVSVKAGPPVPQLEGFRGYRVEVEVEIKVDKPVISGTFHAAALSRIKNVPIVRSAALSAGLTMDDDLMILDQEIDGGREETKNLRKRSITVPLLLNVH